jgi:hypothetical protein
MKLNITKNQTKYIFLKVSKTHSLYLRPIGDKGRKYLPVFLTSTLGELMLTLDLRRILTHNPKGLPIIFLNSLNDGVTHDLPPLRKVCFKLTSCLELCIKLYLIEHLVYINYIINRSQAHSPLTALDVYLTLIKHS